MTSRRQRGRAARTVLIAVLVLFVAVILTAVVGSVAPRQVVAHAGLESSTPAPSSVLEESPPVVSLDFDEDINVPLTSIELFDSELSTIPLGSVERGSDGSIVEAAVPTLDNGTYAVIWRISSADGHVVTGAFSFQIGTSSTADEGELISAVSQDVSAEPSVGRALGVARFASFAGVALLVGGLFMAACTATSAQLGRAARRVLWIGWALAMLGSLAHFGLAGANAAAGDLGDAFEPSLWGDIGRTRTGRLLVVRMVLLLVAATWLWTLASRALRWWRISVAAASMLTVLTFSSGGHPSVEKWPAPWVALDAVHLSMVALWLGGLVMLATGGRAWLRDATHTVAVRRFSRMATIGIPVVVLTGVLQTWRLSGGFGSLTDTTWGRVLLAKGTLAVLIVTIGAGSRWLLVHDGPTGLRRSVFTEMILGVVVLALSAGMVGVPPEAAARSSVFTASLAQAGVLVEVSLTPGRVGSNQVHVVVVPPGGSLVPVASLSARMSLPADDVPATPVSLAAESPNHYSGTITLAFAGEWKLDIVVSPQPTQSILLSTVVPIP